MKDWLERKIKPMLANSSPPFDSAEHIYELKWDGTRCLAFIGGRLRLQNRRLRDITYRYPELSNLPSLVKAKEAILDGEIVVLVEGKPNFQKLQEREHVDTSPRLELLSLTLPATYIAFDLLYLDGRPLIAEPLMERRKWLEGVVKESPNFLLSQYVSDLGKAFFEKAVAQSFEGIMAKKKGSPYLMGERSYFWLKVKKANIQDCLICGYTEGYGRRGELLGSLILGAYKEGRLVHLGQVGTGFTEEELKKILFLLRTLETKFSPFSTEPEIIRGVNWTEPRLVCRVEYQEWTKEGRLRAPRYKGLREDKDPQECIIDYLFSR